MGMLASILVPMAIAFIGSYWIAPKFIRLLELEGIVGTDVQKKEKPKVAEMGAPIVLFGFLGGIFAYIGAQTFLIRGMMANELVTILAVISTLMIITFIGVIDELTCLVKEREGQGLFEKFKRKGLSQWMQVILPLPAAIPLMAISAGVSTLSIPLIGTFDIGILYPLIVVPLAIVGTSNATNMLAGFNGLQAGLGIVMMLFLGSYAYFNGSVAAAVLAFVFMAALFAFIRYNWYPAKIFPGGLDYIVGTMIGVLAVIGNMEKFAVICFAPWFLELLLKARSRFKAENFGIIQNDGTLKAPDSKIGSVTHIVMRLGRFTEWQVSLIIIIGITLWCAFISLLFWLQSQGLIL
jgi:UDP-N-acetylglucosamine--dolichyl-phosphate N-acetylglucosaminephosphotransferase